MKISNKELKKITKSYIWNCQKSMRGLASVIPEINKRQFYLQMNCKSIYQLAAHGHMTKETVDKILRLAERFKDKPKLMALLEDGKTGWSKLEVVGTIAAKETDAFWADKVKNLTKIELETFVRELKLQNEQKIIKQSEQENNNPNGQFSLEGVTGKGQYQNSELFQSQEQPQRITKVFSVSPEVDQKLQLLKQKLGKEEKRELTWNEVFEAFLEGKQVVEENVTIELCPNCIKEKEANREAGRHRPINVERLVRKRSGGICEFTGCCKPGEIFHHTRTYALVPNHDPDYIVYLCKGHERLAHQGLINNEQGPPETWQIRLQPDIIDPKHQIDLAVQRYRKFSLTIPIES